MFWRQNPRQIFISALVLLLMAGVATGFTVYRLYHSETWVRHTFRVQIDTAGIETNLAKAGRSRQAYLTSGDPKYLQDLEAARSDIFVNLSELRRLTIDNQEQLARCDKLELAIHGRFGALDKSVQLYKEGHTDLATQSEMTTQVVNWAFESAAITDEMNHSEEALLDRRINFTSAWFVGICILLGATFLFSIYLFWEHYRVLAAELQQRKKAEEDAYRLSGEVLRAQDEERRRISRELHDGLGQTITGAKMLADSFFRKSPTQEDLQELSGILQEAVMTTRTVSHLLHPPLLDEIGFLAAARWFIDGFTKRTGILVTHNIPEEDWRLAPVTELTLFRVLQESLMNVQRHSGSKSASVQFSKNAHTVSMSIRDFGSGLPNHGTNHFAANGAEAGVGLPGMKQRVLEQTGKFSLTSDPNGTVVSVSLPIATPAN